jgi:hypothetical protein
MLVNSQIYSLRSPTDRNSQPRSQNRRQTQTTTNEQQKSEQNNIQKK